ncbi:MAG: hypothetical protein ACYTDU_19390, partial [Planctomycetota bacterium]
MEHEPHARAEDEGRLGDLEKVDESREKRSGTDTGGSNARHTLNAHHAGPLRNVALKDEVEEGPGGDAETEQSDRERDEKVKTRVARG